jgi:cellulose synthase/poly-beta-1,6-N-acetylglucosamine synthase-like glycosyltransferase
MGFFWFVFVVLFLGYCALILYYRAGWNQLEESKLNKHWDPESTVSIIIPARNEEHNITQVLKDILSQYYPTHLMEVIVVNDHSEDKTAELVLGFPGVQLINLEDRLTGGKLNAYKKRAIEEGIRQATGKIILTTDADCRIPPYWLLSMVSAIEVHNYVFVAGPVTMPPKTHWFSYFQFLDFATMQGITGAVAFHEQGAMCNGANLAYTKEAFLAVDGFTGIDAIASGDDMLLMHKIQLAFPKQSTYLKCTEAVVETDTLMTFKGFMNQRIRWASKALFFTDRTIKSVLFLVYFFNLSFLCIALLMLWKGSFAFLFLGLLLGKSVIEWLLVYPVLKFFKSEDKSWWLYPLQLVHIPYIILSGFLGQLGSYTWKDRRVK